MNTCDGFLKYLKLTLLIIATVCFIAGTVVAYLRRTYKRKNGAGFSLKSSRNMNLTALGFYVAGSLVYMISSKM